MGDLRELIKLDILNNEVFLEKYCEECVMVDHEFGASVEEVYIQGEYGGNEKCGYCNGERFILTPSGEAILSLVNYYIPKTYPQK